MPPFYQYSTTFTILRQEKQNGDSAEGVLLAFAVACVLFPILYPFDDGENDLEYSIPYGNRNKGLDHTE